MKKFLNILGSIFVFILIFGGLPLMSKEGAHIGTVGPIIFYLVGAILCFWGANKHDNNNSTKSATTKTFSATQPSNPTAEELVKEMYAPLLTNQRIAIMKLMQVLGASCDGSVNQINQIDRLIARMGRDLGITGQQVRNADNEFDSMEKIVCVLKTINERVILDTVFLGCFDVVGVNRSKEGIAFLVGVFGKLGYSEDDCLNVLEKTRALMNLMK